MNPVVPSAVTTFSASSATLSLIKFKSVVFEKSIFFSAATALGSLIFSAFTLTTSTTEFNAAVKAPFSEAPAPSAAEANEEIAVVICLLILATSKAFVASTPSAKGLKLKGSTPSGRPKT